MRTAPQLFINGGRSRGSRKYLTVLVALAALTALGAGPGTATAARTEWSCGVTNPGVWCINTTQHAYWAAGATYGGPPGPLPVCEETLRASNRTVYQKACANRNVEAQFELCGCGGLEGAYEQQPDGIHLNGHHIDGWGAY
jgi:ABC-type sugar transport system substrate-binding protein